MRALPAIADDDPITLAEASEVVLRGAISVATLRAEIRRGNLVVERIGKNLFTTPNYIREMRKRCRVQQNRPASISDKTKAEGSGSSATATATDEQAVLKKTAAALRSGLLSTSRKSTRQARDAVAEVMQFPSRK